MNVSCVCGVLDGRSLHHHQRRRNSRHRRRLGFRRKPRRASAGGSRVDRFWLFHVTKQFWPNERDRERESDPSEMSVCVPKNTTWLLYTWLLLPPRFASTLLRALFMGRTPRQKAEPWGGRRREKRLRISDFIIVLSCFIYFGWRVPLDTAGCSEKREVATPGFALGHGALIKHDNPEP